MPCYERGLPRSREGPRRKKPAMMLITPDWVQALSAAFIAVLTLALVLITRVYAKHTKRMVEEMKAQAEALTRPYVTVGTFVPRHQPVLYLRIENTGRTAAENLRLSVDRDFWQYGRKDTGRNLKDFVAFNEPIGSLAPGAKFVFALGPAAVVLGDDADDEVTPTKFTITANYVAGTREVEEATMVDLAPYLHTQAEPDALTDHLKTATKSLEKVSQSLQKAERHLR